MKRLSFFILSLFLLISSVKSGGQVLLTKHDSIRVIKDTTIQLIVKDYRGNIQWQESMDGKTWINLPGKVANSLVVRPDHEAFYRATVKEGTCNPVYSDSAGIVFTIPSVTTLSITDITQTTATGGGMVTSDGGSMVTTRGVCWSTYQNPAIAGSKTTNGTGPGSFISSLTNLTANTPYYVRAYATNSKGTAYGSQVSFTTKPIDTNTVTDIDGNVYPTVKIGEQTWMKENLRVTHAPDGTAITGYLYNNDAQYEKTHGRLYSWDAAMNGSSGEKAQGICPKGWHIPSDEEVKILEISVGMTRAEADMTNDWRGAPVGTRLKAGGTSGFELQLSGLGISGGFYYYIGSNGYLWTSTAYGENAWRRCLSISSEQVGRWNTWPKTYCLSVRCLKD